MILCQLKTAAAFALLGGRLFVSEDDWALAGQVRAMSDLTRQRVVDALQTVRADETPGLFSFG